MARSKNTKAYPGTAEHTANVLEKNYAFLRLDAWMKMMVSTTKEEREQWAKECRELDAKLDKINAK